MRKVSSANDTDRYSPWLNTVVLLLGPKP